MKAKGLFYRLKQKLNYRLTKSEIEKTIIEINKYEKKIVKEVDSYYIQQLNLSLPEIFRFVFLMYDLFLSNAIRLNGKYFIQDDKLIFEFSNYSVHISSASEIYIINEIFVEGCYDFSLPTGQNTIVVDIGMNVGLASLFFAEKSQVEKVYSYELFPSTFEKASFNLELNEEMSKKIEAHNYGLSNESRNLELSYNDENSGVNSIFDFRKNENQNIRKEYVSLKNVYSVLHEIIAENPKSQLILKIDTEGAEYEMIDELGEKGFHENIKLIMMEWHYKGYDSLVKVLNNNGFKTIAFNYGPNSGMIYATK